MYSFGLCYFDEQKIDKEIPNYSIINILDFVLLFVNYIHVRPIKTVKFNPGATHAIQTLIQSGAEMQQCNDYGLCEKITSKWNSMIREYRAKINCIYKLTNCDSNWIEIRLIVMWKLYLFL